MTIKRLTLTAFFIALTLSIGLTSFNLQSSPNQVFALENRINDAVKKACPSYENSNGIKGVVSNALRACVGDVVSPNSPPTLPPPNGAKAHLTIEVWPAISSSDCAFAFHCAGIVYGKLHFRDHSDFSNSFSETLRVPSNGHSSIFEREILVGGKYDIAFEPDRQHFFHFTNIDPGECGFIQEHRGGVSTCEGTKGPSNSNVLIEPIIIRLNSS